VRSEESEDSIQESGVRSEESGVRSEESGVRSQELGDGDQESGVRSQELGGRSQETVFRSQEYPKGHLYPPAGYKSGVRMREPAKTFKDLIVWQRAHQLVLSIYKITSGFPKHELYGLVAQIRRASVSTAANIAEGFRKRTPADKARFLNISQGSLEEVRYYLILAEDLKYANTNELHMQLTEVSKLLEAYRSSILTPDS